MNTSSSLLVPYALLAFVCGVLMAPEPVAACSRSAPAPTLVGQPANDDRQVPTNVALYYQVPDGIAKLPGDYVLRTESGEQVAIEVTLTPTKFVELKPKSALRPNTSYRLDAQWQLTNGMVSESWLRFETAAGPIEKRPDAPHAVLHTYQLGRVSDTCAPMRTGTCVAVADDDAYLEYNLIDAVGQVQPPRIARGSFVLTALSAGGAGNQCVDLRVRAADGTRSEPLRLCGKAQPEDLTMLVGEPQVLCASKGLQWCDTSGHRGIAPGPDVPATVEPDLTCGSSASSQSAQAQEVMGAAGGAAPASSYHTYGAASGCSALPGRSQNLPSLTTFAMLGYFLLRRRRH